MVQPFKEEKLILLRMKRGQLYKLVPELSSEATVFHPSWVRKNSVTYSNNNAYLIIDSDGMDPVFGDILVLSGNMVIFLLSLCTADFDSHFHAYAITATSNRILPSNLLDHNGFHATKLSNGLMYIALRNYFWN